MEVSMKPAAVGFRAHSGWTSLVVVALERGKPMVLARHRPQLISTFSYTFRQPYHTAEKMELAEAVRFLERQRAETRGLAQTALRAAGADVAEQGYELAQAVLLVASGRPLPELPKILAAHSLIHAADGEFFRDAILDACARRRLAVTTSRDRNLLAAGASTLGRSPAALARFLTDLGKPLGSPWSQDEKFATLAAWLALAA
jgi:hypothetical protein